MDIKSIRKNMAAVDGGAWVSKAQAKVLGDMRVKVRGMGGEVARDLYAEKCRKETDLTPGGDITARASTRIMRQVIAEHCLMEIEGLTDGGKPVTAEDLRPVLASPAYEPLCDMLVVAVAYVDGITDEKAAVVEKN